MITHYIFWSLYHSREWYICKHDFWFWFNFNWQIIIIHIHGVHDSICVSNIHWAKDIWITSLSISKIYIFIVVMILKFLSSSCSEIYNTWWFSARNLEGIGEHYAQWNKWSTETVLILVNEFLSHLIQCPGASLWRPEAESMMSVPCIEGGIEINF
jgi:hypothetical protein